MRRRYMCHLDFADVHTHTLSLRYGTRKKGNPEDSRHKLFDGSSQDCRITRAAFKVQTLIPCTQRLLRSRTEDKGITNRTEDKGKRTASKYLIYCLRERKASTHPEDSRYGVFSERYHNCITKHRTPRFRFPILRIHSTRNEGKE